MTADHQRYAPPSTKACAEKFTKEEIDKAVKYQQEKRISEAL